MDKSFAPDEADTDRYEPSADAAAQTWRGVGDGRRLLGRQPVEALVRVTRTDRSPPFWALAQDIHQTGVFICTAIQLELDSLVGLEILVQAGEGLRIYCLAEVVTRVPGAGCGCRFVEISPVDRSGLARLLAQQRPGPRSRHIGP